MWSDSLLHRSRHGGEGIDSYHAGAVDFYHRLVGGGI